MDLWHTTAMTCLVFVYISGIFCCVFTVIGMQIVSVYRCSFGYIITYKCVASTVLLTILLFWTIPCSIWRLDATYMKLNARIGFIIMLFNTPVYISNVVVSASRLITVAAPSKSHWFSGRRTTHILIFVSVVSVTYSLLYFPEDCSMYFNSEDMLFYFAKTECGELVAFYGDFLTGVSMFTVCLVMDLVSILYLRRARKRVGNSLAIGKKKERFKREVVMTVQTFINTSLFYIMVFSYHYAYALFSACPLVVFLSTNFLWSVVIASGGYTAVFINKDLRGTLMHPSRLYGRKLTSESILTHRTPCPTELVRG